MLKTPRINIMLKAPRIMLEPLPYNGESTAYNAESTAVYIAKSTQQNAV
jgi:hypothetical protein